MDHETYTAAALRSLEAQGVDITADDYRWYGPFCAVVTRYTHGKLTVDDIMRAADQLSDLLLSGLKGFFEFPLPKDDRMPGLIRAMEFVQETKGKLTSEEKAAFAFCVLYVTCMRVYDEERGEVVLPCKDFKSFEKIDSIYRQFREMTRYRCPRRPHAELTADFGFSKYNPICAISIPASYEYLRRLRRADGEPCHFKRLGSYRTPGGTLLDMWNVQYGNQQATFYVNAYSASTSTYAPTGWVLGE